MAIIQPTTSPSPCHAWLKVGKMQEWAIIGYLQEFAIGVHSNNY